ncbi:hypothetical protein CTI12_AA308240 [Artemisia annua]|uniref:Uncharacterized protein n=1 Tax=Artemisia annua TaxID=35608 RepID=A0A2U1N4R8_ARTAN|nr:hypothetical protein CTI12_AA308240 [Artemisia annua]
MVTLKLMLFLLFMVVCQQQSSTGVVDGNDFPERVERFVMETESDGEDSFSTMVLAKERTRRKDPSNYFKYYDGGWNITDDHYFASVAYSAAPLFTIATIWFMGFGLSLLVICSYYICCRRTPYGYSRTAYALSVAFLTLFTISAIVGCVILYTGQERFHNSTTATLDYVVKQSKNTSYNLNNVLDILDTAKGIGVDQFSLPESIKDNIDRVDTMVNEAATDLEFETADNENDIQYVLNSVRLSLIIIAAVMLLVALLGFLLSIFGLQVLVYVLVVFGWILVTSTFILGGIANKIINNVANIDPPPIPGFPNYNQSGPLVPTLCNPLNADKTDRICQPGELDASNASQVWKGYVCQVSAQDTCTTVGRLTPKMYDQMSAAANVTSGLTQYGPFLVGLLNCTFVRDTFTGIHKDHCPDLTKYSRWVYIGLAMVSVAVLLSLVLWVLYARERRHRVYTKRANREKGQVKQLK